MTLIKNLKGMPDLFEEDLATWRQLESVVRETFLAFGYGEIRTPLVEETALFVRGVGEGTDIVTKEMYAFEDKDRHATNVCLRPENTAGVVRAMVQHGKLMADAEEKVFYLGSMFRRENVQAGRQRQFNQIGAEAFGIASPSLDVESMALVHVLLERLGIGNVTLLVNSLGDAADRPRFTEALRAYFEPHKASLCIDCQRRLETNPLRVLDCKVESDKKLAAGAPRTLDHLGDESKKHFDDVIEGLTKLGLPFEIDTHLVRGLDYYTRTVFEAVAREGLGAQSTVCAGGRYDNLVAQLGGRPTPAVGFAGGIERLVMLMKAANKSAPPMCPTLTLVGADDDGRREAHRLALALRREGVSVDVDHRSRSVKAMMKRADRSGARFALVLGSREIQEQRGDLKAMATGVVVPVALEPAALLAAVRAPS
jgi:histidyl-tRNA synthetase